MRHHDSPRQILTVSLAPEAPLQEALRWVVAHASLAPSQLNSQPWRFRAEVDPHSSAATIKLFLDESRALPAIDPGGREAVLACGAALLNLRLALRGAALGATLRLCPDPRRPELLGEVSVRGPAVEPDEDRWLRLAIPSRTTHRASFEPTPVPRDQVDALVAEAAYEGAFVAVLDDADRAQLATLNAEAERRLWVSPAFRHEVMAWSRTNDTSHPDGVPGFAQGHQNWQSWLEPARLTASHSGVEHKAPAASSVEGAPALLVICAADESREALLRAGSGMQRLLLRATSTGLAASYLNAALHVPELRQALGRALRVDHPQVVLRVGYATLEQPTPRRRGTAVLDVREVSTTGRPSRAREVDGCTDS